MHRRVVFAVTIAVLVLLALPLGAALAYGAADQPVAQLTFSGNCDNPAFPLCAPPSATSVGTGGIWLWIELDAGGTGDVAGAECIHTIGGVHGPGGAGALPIKGDVTWSTTTTIPANAFPVGQDPSGQYYLVTLPTGDVFAFPVTQGHYAWHPVPGVALEATVAP